MAGAGVTGRGSRRGAPRAVSGSTLVLIGLWTLTVVGVFAAQSIRPAAPVRLSLSVSSLAFTLSGEHPQLLVGARQVPSLTIAGFRSVQPEARALAAGASPFEAVDGGGSLTVRPAGIESVTAPPLARVRVGRTVEEAYTRITVSRLPAVGTVRLPADATVSCHRCGADAAWSWLSGWPGGGAGARAVFRWEGRGEAGGTDLLLQTGGDALVISDDDLRIQGDLETREPSGDGFVSTIHGGMVELLNVGRTRDLPPRARLTMAGIEPRTAVLKRLETNDQGVAAIIEARLDTLSIEEAGRSASLLPSYLEIGFQNQRWLYLTQGVVLLGGTLSKLVSTWKTRGRTP